MSNCYTKQLMHNETDSLHGRFDNWKPLEDFIKIESRRSGYFENNLDKIRLALFFPTN